MCLSNRAVLVSIGISQWSGKKVDQTVTSKATAAEGAAPGSGKYDKWLVPKSEIDKYVMASTQLRAWFYKNSLPYEEEGWRIVPTSQYQEFMRTLGLMKDEVERVQKKFVLDYPTLRNLARASLAGMYRESDYPDSVARYFGVTVDVKPVPSGSHIQGLAGLTDEDKAAMQESMARREREALDAAQAECRQRVADALRAMVNKFSVPADTKGQRIHESIVTNLAEVAELMPKLWVGPGADEFKAIAEQAKAVAHGVDLEAVKESQAARTAALNAAQDALSRIMG